MRRWGGGAAAVALVVVAVVLVGFARPLAPEPAPAREAAGVVARPATTTTTVPPSTTTTAAPTTTTAPPSPATTTTRPPTPAAAPVRSAGVASRDTSAYDGLGTWADVFDWSASYTHGSPSVGVADVDRMAGAGVQTLYVQAARADNPADVLEPELLLPLVQRAHADHLKVVAWYLPTLTDPAGDMRRLMAVSRLPIDGLAVDIEARDVTDVGERNRRLVELLANLRHELPTVGLGAIAFPPVVMEVVNPSFWPGFPWGALAPLFDVWLPMSYQSDRTAGTSYRNSAVYLADNIDRLRRDIGQPAARIHAIGGIADQTSADDVQGLLQACVQRRCIGGSLYDWRTTGPGLFPSLQTFRARR